MKELSMNPDDYNLCNPQEVQRFLMTGQAELLNFLHRIETDFSQVTECFTQYDIASSDPNSLVQLDVVTHRYIEALIALHVYYQQLLKIRDIETPVYWNRDSDPQKSN